jgi:hypothetical protein
VLLRSALPCARCSPRTNSASRSSFLRNVAMPRSTAAASTCLRAKHPTCDRCFVGRRQRTVARVWQTTAGRQRLCSGEGLVRCPTCTVRLRVARMARPQFADARTARRAACCVTAR